MRLSRRKGLIPALRQYRLKSLPRLKALPLPAVIADAELIRTNGREFSAKSFDHSNSHAKERKQCQRDCTRVFMFKKFPVGPGLLKVSPRRQRPSSAWRKWEL